MIFGCTYLKAKCLFCLPYGFIYPEAKCSFFFSSPMDTIESYMGVLGEIDVWDGLDDVDLEQSISYNALDNEHRARECSEEFSTNEVWSMLGL